MWLTDTHTHTQIDTGALVALGAAKGLRNSSSQDDGEHDRRLCFYRGSRATRNRNRKKPSLVFYALHFFFLRARGG
jgi:hypothetical protein